MNDINYIWEMLLNGDFRSDNFAKTTEKVAE